MAYTIKSTLGEEARRQVGSVLQEQLSELLDLSLQGKQAHWNVVGSRFRDVHLQLDELVDAYRLWSDTVAERMTAVGQSPDGQARAIAEGTSLATLPSGPLRDQTVSEQFAERVFGVASRTRGRMEQLADVDPVSADLLTELLDGLEKQLWMLQASVS